MNTFKNKPFFLHIAKSDVLKIAVATTLTFVILHFIRITLLIGGEETAFFFANMWNKICLPPTLTKLLYQPWSLVTYMFTDMSFMRILGNLIWLWVFGMVIEDLKGMYHVLSIYLIGGIVGGFCMVAFTTFYPSTQATYFAGGLGALIAVAIATIIYKPMYEVWFFGTLRVRMWVIVGIFVLLNLVSINVYTLSMLSMVLGGALVGVAYNFGLSGLFEWTAKKFALLGGYFSNNENFILKKEHKLRVHTNNTIPYRTIHVDESKIDRILDKINEKGMQSLTDHEKKVLEDYSKK